MWWVVNLALSGIVGVAKVILEGLRREAARERQEWERKYREYEQTVRRQQQEIAKELRKRQTAIDIARLRNLHHASVTLADQVHLSLTGARKTLDALGQTIVKIAIERKNLEDKKRSAPNHERSRLQDEIMSLHLLRDDVLTPDKDKVKTQRDTLLFQVKELNMQSAQLRDVLKTLQGSGRR